MNRDSGLTHEHMAIVNELDKSEMVKRGLWSRWTFDKTPCVDRLNPERIKFDVSTVSLNTDKWPSLYGGSIPYHYF